MHDIRSLIARCETMQIASLNASELNESKLMGLWNALAQFIQRQLGSGRAANIPSFGRFGHTPQGAIAFTLSREFTSRYGLQATKPVVLQERSADISWAGLGLAAGVNKDAARVGLTEILQKFGHYAGELRQAARLQFRGVATLHATGGTLKVQRGGGGHSRKMQHSATMPALNSSRSNMRVVVPQLAGMSGKAPSPLAGAGKMVTQQQSARMQASARHQASTRHRTSGSRRSGRQAGPAQPAAATRSPVWGASEAAIANAGVDPKLLSSYNRRPLGVGKKVTQKEALEYNVKMAEEKARREAEARERQTDDDMARLVQLQADLEEDAREAARVKKKRLRLSKEQQRDARRKMRQQKRELDRERAELPDTQWKFGDNDLIAEAQARARATQKAELDKQHAAKVALLDSLPLSQRGMHASLTRPKKIKTPKQHPVFLPRARSPPRGRVVPAQAAEAAYREAYQRHEKMLEKTLELNRRKDAEVARHAQQLDEEYMRRKRDRRRNQRDMNRTLETQVMHRKQDQEKTLTSLLTEAPPDHSHVHPEEANRNYLVEEQAKAALRAALDEQVRQRAKKRKKDRRRQIRQDRFFIKGVNEAMSEDRKIVAQKKQTLSDSLHYEWQRQQDLAKLMQQTEKKLR